MDRVCKATKETTRQFKDAIVGDDEQEIEGLNKNVYKDDIEDLRKRAHRYDKRDD